MLALHASYRALWELLVVREAFKKRSFLGVASTDVVDFHIALAV